MENTRTLNVTGKGRVRLRPDLTVVSISLEGVEKDYPEALRRASRDTDALAAAIMPAGFERSALKTLSFDVDTEYESYQENGAYKQRLVGYRYLHRLKLEFDSDSERLGMVLGALAGSRVGPRFRISFLVKDREAARNEALENAVRDARNRAAVLAAAAGARLGAVLRIDSSWGEANFRVELMDRPMDAKLMSCDAEEVIPLDVEPDDVELSDTVTVVWELA